MRQSTSMERKMVNLLELTHVVQLLEKYSSRRIVEKAILTAGLDRAMLGAVSGSVPYAAEAILIESVARAIGDRHLGARIGRDFHYLAYGAYAYFVLSAPDLATALDRGRRVVLWTHPGSEIAQRETDTHLVVGHSKDLSVTGHRHLDEGTLFVIGHLVRHFLGVEWKPDWVEIPGKYASDITILEDLVGAPVCTGAAVPSIAIRWADLTALNPAPPLPDQTISLDELKKLMGIAPVQTMEDAVVQILSITLATRQTNESTAARLLSIGVRSLQRALKDEGTTFREIRARVVSRRASSLLENTDMPIEQIALMLGFSQAKNFRRAFKSATGLSPSAFRETDVAE